jgi:hypothetical protein
LAADHEGDIGRCEIAVDLLQFKDLVMGNVSLGEQHVHVARHAPGDRMDRILHHAFGTRLLFRLFYQVENRSRPPPLVISRPLALDGVSLCRRLPTPNRSSASK